MSTSHSRKTPDFGDVGSSATHEGISKGRARSVIERDERAQGGQRDRTKARARAQHLIWTLTERERSTPEARRILRVCDEEKWVRVRWGDMEGPVTDSSMFSLCQGGITCWQ